MNVALLSRWHVHADDYAREALENEHIDIKLVWDEDVARGEAWAAELGVGFEGNLEKVLSNEEIDAVIVTTPTNMHKEVIMAAAKHGKHIFTEKVLAFSVKDCKEILGTVEQQGVHLMVSMPRFSDSDYLHAQQALDSGWLGKLTMIRCRLAHNGGVVPEGATSGWLPDRFFDRKAAGGGALIDLGAHPIYLTNRLAGKAENVYALMKSQNERDVDESATAVVAYESGAVGIIESGFLSHGSPFQLELYGTEGTFLLKDGQPQLKSIHYNEDQWTILEGDLPAVPMPMVQWTESIKSGREPHITKEDIIHLTLINEAAAISDHEGRRVSMEEIMGKVD